MKLQVALIFGEHMVLQRDEPVPVWGRSVRDDQVTVALGGSRQTVRAEGGRWRALLPPMPATERTEMTVSSQLTGERLTFQDVAVGEVWLAGGQSNMEFHLKFDQDAEEMYQTGEDPGLRFIRYPQANFVGCVEKEPYPDEGFWRAWSGRENRGMFSAAAAYMGRKLRESLGVPVGFIGVNGGGTPAAAWTDPEDIKANPALQPVLDWYQEGCRALDLQKYFALSDQPQREPSPEEQKRMNDFMMGIGLEELFKNGAPPPPPPMDYTPYMVGPRGAVRPGGLYENMLKRVAPYAVRGVVWYQGEDDDFRGWQDFYDESMKTLIQSWRRLWGKELPFLQVELAPFQGRGVTGAKHYNVMRAKQRAAADALAGVHNVCIMDAGDKINIHVRKKKPVGERLALLARKYVYGEDILADSPRYMGASREGDRISVAFKDGGGGLVLKGEPGQALRVTVEGEEVFPAVSVAGGRLLLTCEAFRGGKPVQIELGEQNFCEMPLFNSAGLPAFPFTALVEEEAP